MLPATLDDLLFEAECAVGILIARRPPARALTAGWPAFTSAAQRLMSECLRAGSDGSDFDSTTRGAVIAAARPGSPRPEWVEALPGTDRQLTQVTDLLGATTDLLAQHVVANRAFAKRVAVRAAGVIGGACYAVATAEGSRRHEPMAFHAVQLQIAVNRVLDAGRGIESGADLTRIAAEPLSEGFPARNAGAKFQAATLAWQRAASAGTPISSQTLTLSAITVAQTAAYVWQALDEAGRHGTLRTALPAREAAVATYQSWREVAHAWRRFTTATPAPTTHRALAKEVLDRAQTLGVELTSSRTRAEQAQLAATRGMGHLARLAHHDHETVGRLASGGLYVSASMSPSSDVYVIGRPRTVAITCPPALAGQMQERCRLALTHLHDFCDALAVMPQRPIRRPHAGDFLTPTHLDRTKPFILS